MQEKVRHNVEEVYSNFYKMSNLSQLGYKVSLYTDSLRATTLLTIYINSLSLVSSKETM